MPAERPEPAPRGVGLGDQDGETDDGELKTLADWDITEITLSYDEDAAFGDEDDDITILGNTLHGFASFVMGGSTIVGGVGDVSLEYNTYGWREIATTGGYAIEFENGVRFDYGEAEKRVSAEIDLTAENLDGATGDDRNNVLSATNHLKAVAVAGGAGDDMITGGWGDDMLSGDGGADSLNGGAGHDTIFFDAADLSVRGGAGYDVAIATEWEERDENDVVTVTANAVTLDLEATGFEAAYGGDGDDTLSVSATFDQAVSLHGKGGDDTLTGGAANDTLSGDEGDDVLTGNGGDDLISGGEGNDTADGGAGDDFMLGGAGDDSLNGEGGDDFILGGIGHDTITGGAGDDFIDGGDGVDVIDGGNGDDFIVGGLGYDHLTGGSGDDFVSAGAGDDVMVDAGGDDFYDGGAGDDTLEIDKQSSNGKDIFFGGEGFDSLVLSGGRSNYTITDRGNGSFKIERESSGYTHLILTHDVERIVFLDGVNQGLDGTNEYKDTSEDYKYSSAADGVLLLYDEKFDGASRGKGNDWVEVLHTDNRYDDVSGGNGNDTIMTADGNDDIKGNSGEDTLLGGDHDDTIEGGSGDDIIKGQNGADTLDGGSGADYVHGGDGADTIEGGTGSDILKGSEGADTITDAGGADYIFGGQGADTIDAGDGDDQIFGGIGADTINAGLGDDLVEGDSGHWTKVTTHLIRFLGRGATGVGNSEARTDELNDGQYSYADLINYQLGIAYGHTADGETFGETDIEIIADHEINTTHAEFLSDVLPRAFDRAPTTDETAYWRRQLQNGLSYAALILILIEEDLLAAGVVSDALSDMGVYDGSYNDTIDGGAGNDQIDGDLGDDSLTGGAGFDYITGGGGDDTIDGGADDDTLIGGYGDDTLIGGEGADVLEGGMGADALFGDNQDGSDPNPFDRISYASSHEGVQIDLAAGTASGGHADGDSFSGIEGVIGSLFDDTLTGDDNANYLAGGAGDDRLDGAGGHDVLDGGSGDDLLIGGDGDDQLYGDLGHDLLEGGADDDLLVGGGGRDVLWGGDGADYLAGEGSVDIFVLSGDGEDIVEDFVLDEDFIGLTGGTLFGDLTLTQDSDDVLVDDGTSTLRVKDLVVADLTEDRFTRMIEGPAGANTADYSGLATALFYEGRSWVDTITGTTLADTIAGGGGTDVLNGGDGDDLLRGGNGDDILTGGDGADILMGGRGDDQLNGGLGDDIYVVKIGPGGSGETGHDTIVDTDGENTIRIEGWWGDFYDITATSSGNDLTLTFGASGQSVMVSDQWTDLELPKVEWLTLASGEDIDMRRFHEFGGDDELDGTSGDDVINAFVGDDTVTASGGTDTIDGGEGDDTFDLSQTNRSSNFDLDAGTLELLDGNGAVVRTQTITNFERAKGNDDANVLLGTDGDNSLKGKGGGDTLEGREGDDDLRGGDNSDTYVYNLGDGNDTITESGGANDRILFGPGIVLGDLMFEWEGDNLLIQIDDGDDDTDDHVITLIEAADNSIETFEFDDGTIEPIDRYLDTDWTGNDNDNTKQGREISETLDGGKGADTIHGKGGDDTIFGGNGNDTITGGAGDDVIGGGNGNDSLDGGEGTDTLDTSDDDGSNKVVIDLAAETATHFTDNGDHTETVTGFENVVGTSGNDTIRGTDEENDLQGGNGNDTLDGRAGEDTIDGGRGTDTIIGGTGDDSLTGGFDDDVFVFNLGDGIDTVTDFADGQDIIRLTGLTFADLLIEDDGSSTTITYEADADGDPTGQIILTGIHGGIINANDFAFV